jgi:type VI secretion system protein
MEDERLLERLRSLEKDPNRREGRDNNRLIRSILSHLERILNTRQGSVPIAEDFGVPDFTNLPGASATESTRDIERSIRGVIQKYEHRLAGVRINFVPRSEDPLSLRFRISARLAVEEDIPIVFNTVIGSDGKINVSD